MDEIGVSAGIGGICCQEIHGAIRLTRNIEISKGYTRLQNDLISQKLYQYCGNRLQDHHHKHYRRSCHHLTNITCWMTEVDKTELIINTATAILHVTMFAWLDSNGKTSAS